MGCKNILLWYIYLYYIYGGYSFGKISYTRWNKVAWWSNYQRSKNAAVAIIPATLLINGVCTVENLPNISDVQIQCKILEKLGAKVEWLDNNTVRFDTSNIESYKAPLDMTSKFRSSYYLIGALLGRCHNQDIEVGLPGGCKLGARPIDQHIKGFLKL